MRIAWLLGVFLLLPQPGRAASQGAGLKLPAPQGSQELDFLLDSGELPPIFAPSLPDRASPDPLAANGPVGAFHLPPLGPGAAIRLNLPRHKTATPAPAPPAAAAVQDPVSEVERLGEDLRDAVAQPPSLEQFLAALRSSDPRGRCEAIETFGYAGNFAAIPYVSAVMLRLDEALPVRVAAARALGRIGDRRARSFLVRAVMDGEAQVRLASAIALGLVRDHGGVKPLVRALQSETDEKVRAAMIWALSTAKSRRS